jgi:hypothetical protein
MSVMKATTDTPTQIELVSNFIENVKDDPRINTAHISLYVSLVNQWFAKGIENPLTVFSKEIMPICKISGAATYHRSIRQLHEYGYIRYIPSYNHFLGSLVYFN